MMLLPLIGALTAAPIASTADASGISWVHDDWDTAARKAKADGKLVAVDVWATWCHTCLSMKNYVLTEPAMKRVAEQHVWLAQDYDLDKNAKFFERHPIAVFPTFLVIDPRTDKVVARWAGSGTAEEMARFFAKAKAGEDPVSRGQRAIAENRPADARRIFEQALAKPPKDRAIHTQLLMGWIEVLYQTDKPTCATVGADRMKDTLDNAQGADFASLVAYCASALEPGPQKAVLQRVVARLAPLVRKKDLRVAVDDRSSILGTLEEAYRTLGDEDAAARALATRRQLLETAASKAKTAAQRATFDYHRMQVYLQTKEYAAAVKMLEASEKAQPTDFNHPWRLAQVHLAQGHHDLGIAAIDRALERGYGGRKLRLYSTKIKILLDAGRGDEARRAAARGEADMTRMSPAQIRPYWKKEFEDYALRAAKERT